MSPADWSSVIWILIELGACLLVCYALWRNMFLKAEARIRAAYRRRSRLRDANARLPREIRRLARQSRSGRLEMGLAEKAVDDMKERIEIDRLKLEVLMAQDRRIIVLDERCNRGDRLWSATVRRTRPGSRRELPDAARAWAAGRRVAVWALNGERARKKIAARYGEEAGYVVEGIAELSVPG